MRYGKGEQRQDRDGGGASAGGRGRGYGSSSSYDQGAGAGGMMGAAASMLPAAALMGGLGGLGGLAGGGMAGLGGMQVRGLGRPTFSSCGVAGSGQAIQSSDPGPGHTDSPLEAQPGVCAVPQQPNPLRLAQSMMGAGGLVPMIPVQLANGQIGYMAGELP